MNRISSTKTVHIWNNYNVTKNNILWTHAIHAKISPTPPTNPNTHTTHATHAIYQTRINHILINQAPAYAKKNLEIIVA